MTVCHWGKSGRILRKLKLIPWRNVDYGPTLSGLVKMFFLRGPGPPGKRAEPSYNNSKCPSRHAHRPTRQRRLFLCWSSSSQGPLHGVNLTKATYHTHTLTDFSWSIFRREGVLSPWRGSTYGVSLPICSKGEGTVCPGSESDWFSWPLFFSSANVQYLRVTRSELTNVITGSCH